MVFSDVRALTVLLPFYLLLTQYTLTLMHNRTHRHSACPNICCTIQLCPSMNTDLCQSLFSLSVTQPSYFTSTNDRFLLKDARHAFHSQDVFKSSAYIFLSRNVSQPRKHVLVVLLSISCACAAEMTLFGCPTSVFSKRMRVCAMLGLDKFAKYFAIYSSREPL